MTKEQIEKLFSNLPKKVVAILAGGAVLATLSGCSKEAEVISVPEPSAVITLRPLPDNIILNDGTLEDFEEELNEATKESTKSEQKPVVGTTTPVVEQAPVVNNSPAYNAPVETVPVTPVPATPAPVIAENPNYPYSATITIPLNNGTNPMISFATSKEYGAETVFISSNSAKICGVVVTQSLFDALAQDPSIQTLEFEGCQIDTLSINDTNVNSLYLWNTYVRQIGSCNVGQNFTLTLNHASLGDPASLRNLPTCTTMSLIGIPSSYFSSIKELPALQTLTIKQSDIPSYDFINNTGVQTLYMESCTLGYSALTSQNLTTFSAFDMDLGDLSSLCSSSVQNVNLRSCSFCNIESLDYSSVLSVTVDDFYANRSHRNNSFEPALLQLYGEVSYTLDLGL